MTTRKQNLTFQTQTCTCCHTAQTLAPREDLPGGLAVCPQSGQLYRPEGQTWVPTPAPDFGPQNRPDDGVQIDLSRYGYA